MPAGRTLFSLVLEYTLQEAFSMKRSTKAATLSFVVPGAGLWYLGESCQAIVNLIVAAVLSAIVTATGHEYLHWGLLAVAAGSSGYAHAVAGALQRRSGVKPVRGSSDSSKAGF